MDSVLTTATFEQWAEAAKLEQVVIGAFRAADPNAGALMRGTGGARKVRFEGNENGKSGGDRTIRSFGGDDVPVLVH